MGQSLNGNGNGKPPQRPSRRMRNTGKARPRAGGRGAGRDYEDLRGDWTAQDERETREIWADMEAERRAKMTPAQRQKRQRMLEELDRVLAEDAAEWERQRQEQYGKRRNDDE